MGCALQTGCLGPKSKARQVYIDLVQTIYEQARQTPQLLNSNNQNIQTSIAIFNLIKARIVKKGLIKKLADNLISHKNHIQDCIKQNQEICIKSSSSIQRITSLLIVDTVLNEISKNRKISLLNLQTEESQRLEKVNSIESTTKIVRQSSQSLILQRNDDSKMDNQIDYYIFNQIIYIFETEEDLYSISINILMKYLNNKLQKLYDKSQIYKIFQILVEKIQNQKDVNTSVRLFLLILLKMKASTRQQDKDQLYIHFFMKKYLLYHKSLNKQPQKKSLGKIQFDIIKQNKQLKSNKKQQNYSSSSIIFQQNLVLISQIMQCFINKYFSEHAIIYESLLLFFDEDEFDLKNIKIIWKLIQKIIKTMDYQNHFIQGFFLNLLEYNLFNHNFQERKSFYYMKEFKHQKYRNITSKICKINGFKLIKFWIIQKDIDINEIILYTCPNILRCYVQNHIYFSNAALQVSLKHEMLQIFSFLGQKQFYMIVDHILSALVQYNHFVVKQNILIQLLTQLSQKNIQFNKLYLETDILDHLLQFLKIQITLKIIKIIKNNLKYMQNYNKQMNIQQNQTLKLSTLLFNLYKLIVQGHQHQQQQNQVHIKQQKSLSQSLHGLILNKHELIEQTVSIIKILLNKEYMVLVIAYAKCINEDLLISKDEEVEQSSVIYIYFAQYLIKQIIFILNKNQKIPQEMIKNHIFIDKNSNNKNFSLDFTQSLQRIIQQSQEKSSFQENTSAQRWTINKIINLNVLLEQNNRKIESTRQFLMIKMMDFNEMVNTIRAMFGMKLGSIIKKESQSLSSKIRDTRLKSRGSLCSDETELENSYSKQVLDQSFCDIMEKIQLG